MRFLHPFAALALLLAACAPAPAQPSQAELASAEAGARALIEEWARTGSEGRWDDLVALYADEPGFAWVEQGRNRYPDHAAIAAGVAQARASGAQVSTTVSNIETTALSADAAILRANVSMTFGAPPDGFAINGVMTAVAVKRGERWQFLQGHISSPQSP